MAPVLSSASDNYSAIAFYGISSDAQAAENFYQTIIRWFAELNCSTDMLSVHGIGYSGKPASFDRLNRKLQKDGFSEVRGFSLFSLLPNAKIPMNDYSLTASYDSDSESSYAFVVARSSLVDLSDQSMLPLAQVIIQNLKPEYGIGYYRDYKLGPSLYAIGVCQGLGTALKGEAYEQALQISRWSNIGMTKHVYRKGVLRDIYPWNFLTVEQLLSKVGDTSLKDWIQQDEKRGSLTLLSNGVWLWKLTDLTDIDRLTVRATLWSAGIIFDWKKHS